MSGSVLLDTSVVVALLRGDASVAGRIEGAAEVLISSTVLGELLFGALRAKRSDEGLRQVKAFAAAVPVLPCDQGTAEAYGRIKNILREKGRPIPENDLWIAAAAQQHGLTVVTRDEHFQDIPDLNHTSW